MLPVHINDGLDVWLSTALHLLQGKGKKEHDSVLMLSFPSQVAWTAAEIGGG